VVRTSQIASVEDYVNFKADVFRALGDPTRLKIILFLRAGERCVCEIVPHVGLAQPTVSRHLSVLTELGILRSRKQGNRVLYSVTDRRIFNAINALESGFISSLQGEVTSRMRR
jgi:DNA-binding transcriptional ArsR family regulator